MVQTVENILKKCEENKEDPYIALLSYRATPLDHELMSPAELLTGRKFRTRLPMSQRALLGKPGCETTRTQLMKRQDKQAHYYNQNSGPPKRPLQTNQPVRVYDCHSQTWQPGTVLKPAQEPRSYIVRSNNTGATYRRTRFHLRPAPASENSSYPQHAETTVHSQGPDSSQQAVTSGEAQEPKLIPQEGNAATRLGSYSVIAAPNSGENYVTKSGRIVIPPQKLNL